MKNNNKTFCSVRKDLDKSDLIPIGDFYVECGTVGEVECRWLNENSDNEEFQIKYEDEWLTAYSMDFEFE